MYEVIYSGEYGPRPDLWEFHILKDDGNKGLHLMPKFALDLRAAEYGVDPTDVDTLMSMLLHEPHMPDEEPTANPLPPLMKADSTTQARNEHLDRVKNCKVQIRIKGSKGLDAIRKGHKPDRDRIKAHREVVDTHRWGMKYGDLPMPPKSPAKQIQGMPFVQTGINEGESNAVPDSMTNGGAITISVKGSDEH